MQKMDTSQTTILLAIVQALDCGLDDLHSASLSSGIYGAGVSSVSSRLGWVLDSIIHPGELANLTGLGTMAREGRRPVHCGDAGVHFLLWITAVRCPGTAVEWHCPCSGGVTTWLSCWGQDVGSQIISQLETMEYHNHLET